ncbi:MAG: hypothetical protein J6R47_03830, partial [Acholeplasmatales bacterium]|nr:hypothetical protein [Acholeplasmatales bacterium]
LIPENVSLADEQLILDTRTAYNLLNQDLTLYGYTQEYLDGLYENLLEAEEAWLELKMARVNKAYKYLIEDIKQLGATYEFDKIAAYYDIVKALELVDRFDEKYVDRTNVDSFKKGFDEYFKDLNEDINASNDITTLPTTTVNKVGLAVVAVISGTSVLGFVGMLIKKRWFF